MTSGDVVVQGREPAPGGPPPWLRRAGLALAAVLVVVGVVRAGLLSGGGAAPAAPAAGVAGPHVVAVDRGRLLVAEPGGPHRGSTLPPGLAADAPLVAVPATADPHGDPVGAGPLLGVHDGLLFRAGPHGRTWQPLGRADRVLGPALTPGRVTVVRGGRVVQVETATGRLAEPDPFPASAGDRFTPLGILSAAGTGALLMAGPAPQGLAGLALALPGGELRDLGRQGPLLGIADDWAVTLSGRCPGAACRLRVVSVTRDLVIDHVVAPPAGWTFVPGPTAGRTHEALVPVRRLAGGTRALARLVPGGDNALLVQGTDAVRIGAGLADGPRGTVYLLGGASGGQAPVLRWDPTRPAAVHPAPGRPRLPTGARLVCVCG